MLVPIQNMAPQDVRYTLSRCKLYIDFGTHPGRDRLPREAVLSSCLIVTGLEGAAGNKIDIPIPGRYKMSLNDLQKSSQRIHALMENYDTNIGDFRPYSNSIHLQKGQFKQEVKALISAVETPDFYTRHLFIEPGIDNFLLKQEILQREKDYMIFALASALNNEHGNEPMQRVS